MAKIQASSTSPALAAAARQCFLGDYGRARSAFVAAAQRAGARLQSHVCPSPGPAGEQLTMDVAYLGEPDATRLLVIASGVHGVEGHAGSAIQIDALRNGEFSRDVAVLLIHAINPFGMAWTCVETEDVLDLNRNFLDYSKPLPQNLSYDEVDAFMCCRQRCGAERDAMDALLASYVESHSREHYYSALANGQRHRPGRFNYGGVGPCWSNTTVRKILRTFGHGAERLGFIDVHTGYGNRGEGIILCLNRDAATSRRAASWWGDIVLYPSEDFPFAPQGCLPFTMYDMFADAEVTAVTLEYGAEAPDRVIESMRNSFWLMNFATADERLREGFDIRAELEACYAPRDSDWREAVLMRGRDAVGQAMAQLHVP